MEIEREIEAVVWWPVWRVAFEGVDAGEMVKISGFLIPTEMQIFRRVIRQELLALAGERGE